MGQEVLIPLSHNIYMDHMIRDHVTNNNPDRVRLFSDLPLPLLRYG